MGFAVRVYRDIAVFQPVVNGVGGNLVAIFASRLSTALHRTSVQGTQAEWAPTRWYMYPFDTFFGKRSMWNNNYILKNESICLYQIQIRQNKDPESSTSKVLLFLAIPGHVVFFFTIVKIKSAQSHDPVNGDTLTPQFILFYLSILFLQVIFSFF